MSRIGKQPISVGEKVTVKLDGKLVDVKGPKGNLQYTINEGVNAEVSGKEINVTVEKENDKKLRSLWGLTRTLINNMVVGVTDGFEKDLEFNGVGYKAAVSGNTLTLNLGYSHPIDYNLPKGVEAKVLKNVITISGCSKELVGFVAAKVRSFRPPEPYKGKGIKYQNEVIIRKAGKTSAK
jgi:large subunit ribosomal protein L6